MNQDYTPERILRGHTPTPMRRHASSMPLPFVLNPGPTTEQILREAYDDGCRRIAADIQEFVTPLDAWIETLLADGLPRDWREQMHEYLAAQEPKGYRVELPNRWVIEDEILHRAAGRGLSPEKTVAPATAATTQSDKRPPEIFIPLPPDYPTRADIATAEAWEALQRHLIQEIHEERTDKVRFVQDAFGAMLRRKLLAQARAARRTSVVSSFIDGFVAGLMTLRATATRNPAHIATRDEAFAELGIVGSAATVTKAAAAVAVIAAEAAVLLVAGGAVLGPVARAFAAYSPRGALATAYAAQGLGGALAGTKLRAAHQAFKDGRTQEGIDLAAEAFVLAVLVAAGPLLGSSAATARPGVAAKARTVKVPRKLAKQFESLDAEAQSAIAQKVAKAKSPKEASDIFRSEIPKAHQAAAARVAAGQGARTVARAKPPFPRPVDEVRVTPRSGNRGPDPSHVRAAKSEEALARELHFNRPDEVVLVWGKMQGTHGADVITYNLKTKRITLWDDKFRTGRVRIKPSRTFKDDSRSLANAVQEARDAIGASRLSPADQAAARASIRNNTFLRITRGSGNAMNSTIGYRP